MNLIDTLRIVLGGERGGARITERNTRKLMCQLRAVRMVSGFLLLLRVFSLSSYLIYIRARIF